MSSEAHIIGTVKGPGDTGNQYVFITADTQHIKIGEFVYFRLQNNENTDPLKILGKISACALVDHLPDRIFADTEIDPSAIAALVGFKYDSPEIYEVGVDVVGYFHPALGFMNPRQPPDPGTKVYLASDDMLRQVLNKKQMGEVGSAAIGDLLLRDKGAVPINLDVKELVSTHIAIRA